MRRSAEGRYPPAIHGADALDDLVPKMTANLPEAAADDAVEGIGEAITKSYRDKFPVQGPVKDPKALTRVDEAVDAGRRALNPHLRNVVAPHIGPDKVIKSMEEFEVLRFMDGKNLTAAQKSAIKAIREAIPNPVQGTAMQKVIKGTEIDGFIGQNKSVTGFVAKTDDAGTGVFHNSDEMIEGNRLDYDGGFQNETSVGIVEWDFNSSGPPVDIPWGKGYDGTIDFSYPFVGSGFSATGSGRLVPEYVAGGTIVPPNGAKLFELKQNGDKVLRATYENGAWSPP